MDRLVIKVSVTLIDELLYLDEDLLFSTFIEDVRAANIDLFLARINKPPSFFDISNGLEVEVAFEIAQHQELLLNFFKQAGERAEQYLALLLDDVVRKLSTDTALQDISPNISRVDSASETEAYDDDYDDLSDSEVRVASFSQQSKRAKYERFSTCCDVKVLEDEEGYLFCPMCGATISSPFPRGHFCQNCGLQDFDEKWRCENCGAYSGPPAWETLVYPYR